VKRGPLLALLVTALLLSGCSTVQLGPVRRPVIYPDRTTHERALSSFFWAWHEGDVRVLLGVLGAWPLKDLQTRLEKTSPAETAEFYRRDAEALTLVELEWTAERKALAYARVVLHVAGKRVELDISLLRRPDGWVVTAQRLLR
jgi:hypothetical protein